jgi:DNA-binding LytR/AlgR family response regulator
LRVNADGRILKKVAGPLSKQEEELGCYGFLRIHQSTLVNLKMVISLKKGELPEVVLRHCTGDKPLEVGPNYRKALEKALDELTKR